MTLNTCPYCRKVSICSSIPDDLLIRLNHNIIYQLPCDNDPQKLSVQTKSCKILTAKGLLKRNVEKETYRFHIDDRCIINLTVDRIWNFMNPSLQQQFTALANGANDASLNKRRIEADNLDRIARLDARQTTSNLFEDNLFNGVASFQDENSNIEFLIRSFI